MTDRELMKQALDALEYASDQTKPENLHGCDCLICTTILALRDRLAQPEQAPVAWITKGGKGDLWWHRSVDENGNDNLDDVPLYMAPPVREWVGLTDEEMYALARQVGFDSELMKSNHDRGMPSMAETFARAIEAAHGIKP